MCNFISSYSLIITRKLYCLTRGQYHLSQRKLLKSRSCLRMKSILESVLKLRSIILKANWHNGKGQRYEYHQWMRYSSFMSILCIWTWYKDRLLSVIGTWKLWDFTASQNAGRWSPSERRTWRRNCNTEKSVVAIELWSWRGIHAFYTWLIFHNNTIDKIFLKCILMVISKFLLYCG